MEGLPDDANLPLQKHGTEDLQTNTHLSELDIDSSMQKLNLIEIMYLCNKNYCPYTLISLRLISPHFAMYLFNVSKLDIDSRMQKLNFIEIMYLCNKIIVHTH